MIKRDRRSYHKVNILQMQDYIKNKLEMPIYQERIFLLFGIKAAIMTNNFQTISTLES